MKVRSSSKKILLWLYSPNGSFRRIDSQQLDYLLPNVSFEGKRSLLYHLQNKKLITVEKFRKSKFLSLTSFGRDFIETNFLSINKERQKWAGDWIMIIIIGQNNKKPNFRHLRSFLIENGCISFERGIYMYPGLFNDSLKNYIKNNFTESVVVVDLKDWLYGDQRMIIMERFQLIELANQYSSISSEIDDLLKKSKEKKRLNDRYYNDIFAIYNRLFPLFAEDLGFLNYYFSNSVSGVQLLNKLQNLFF